MNDQHTETYYATFMEIWHNQNDLKPIIERESLLHGDYFLYDFPKKINSFHDIEQMNRLKDEITAYCKKRYTEKTKWLYRKENLWAVIFGVTTIILTLLGLLVAWLSLNKA